MKHRYNIQAIAVFIVMLGFSLPSLSHAVDYVASGAGHSATNGTYVKQPGTISVEGLSDENCEYWINGNGMYLYVSVASGNYWFIDEDGEGTHTVMYSTNDAGLSPVGLDWFDNGGGNPPPTFSEAASATMPTVSTSSASSVSTASATLGGNVTDDGGASVTERGVVYSSTDSEPEIGDAGVTKDANGSGTGSFSESIGSLSSGTLYYFQAYAINSEGTSYGSVVQTFTTLEQPTVTTQAVSGITTTTATGNGNITDLGNPNPTQHGVCWNTSGTPTVSDSKTEEGAASSTGAFTSSMTGLSSGITYYVRAYATNSVGTSYGTQQTFTTLEQPTVTTQAVSGITTTTATGNGNITDLGNPNPTQHGVCWNTTGTPTVSDSKTEEGAASSTGAFTSSMTGLSSGITYYVRAYATNSVGTSYGTQESFMTVVPDPTSLTATTVSESQIDLTWDGTSSQFRVLQKPDSSSADETDGTNIYEGTLKSFNVTGLDTNTTYFFTVFGMNAAGNAFSSGNKKTVASTLPAEDSTQTNAQVGYLAGETDSTYSYDSLGVEIVITTGSGSDGYLELFRINTSPQSGNLPGSAESELGSITPSVIYDVHFWQVTNNGLTGITYEIIISLDGVPGIGDPTRLCVFKRSSSGDDWSDAAAGGATIAYNAGMNALIISGLSTFSEFAIGSDGGDNPLPVELNGFSGISTSNGIELSWMTQSETNNQGFILMRNGVEIAGYSNTEALQGQGTTTKAQGYNYTDSDVELNATYSYQLVSVDESGVRHTYGQTVEVKAVEAITNNKPLEYGLEQNYPNPFNPSTTITYTMKKAGVATLKVYDMLGRLVIEQTRASVKGENQINFNGSKLTSGMYYYQLNADGFSKTLKMMLVK